MAARLSGNRRKRFAPSNEKGRPSRSGPSWWSGWTGQAAKITAAGPQQQCQQRRPDLPQPHPDRRRDAVFPLPEQGGRGWPGRGQTGQASSQARRRRLPASVEGIQFNRALLVGTRHCEPARVRLALMWISEVRHKISVIVALDRSRKRAHDRGRRHNATRCRGPDCIGRDFGRRFSCRGQLSPSF
jgi:hypothetical protein